MKDTFQKYGKELKKLLIALEKEKIKEKLKIRK